VEIINVGYPALRLGTLQVSPECSAVPLDELIEVTRTTLTGKGDGLAASQIGVPLRLFVIEHSEEGVSHLSAERRAELGRYPHPLYHSQ
jgi:peptide deformylase